MQYVDLDLTLLLTGFFFFFHEFDFGIGWFGSINTRIGHGEAWLTDIAAVSRKCVVVSNLFRLARVAPSAVTDRESGAWSLIAMFLDPGSGGHALELAWKLGTAVHTLEG